MSELKWNWAYLPYLDPPERQKESALKAGYIKVVDKAEADKVIAEKDKEIQRLENLCESYRIDCDNLAIREANAYKEIERDNKQLRHHKYKRCLAMTKWCDYWTNYWEGCVPSDCGMFIAKARFYRRWRNRWLELAEKFKEATCKS